MKNVGKIRLFLDSFYEHVFFIQPFFIQPFFLNLR